MRLTPCDKIRFINYLKTFAPYSYRTINVTEDGKTHPVFVNCESFATFEIVLDTSIVVLLIVNRFFTAYMTIMRLLCVTARYKHDLETNKLTQSYFFICLLSNNIRCVRLSVRR